MYTVVRFYGRVPEDAALYELGEKLNLKHPGMFRRLSKAKTAFSCSVATDGTWDIHSDRLIKFMNEHRLIIRKAQKRGVKMSFDTALEPEDLTGVDLLCWTLDKPLIDTLALFAATIEFSCYLMKRDPKKTLRMKGKRSGKAEGSRESTE